MVQNTKVHVGARFRWDGSLGFFLGTMVSFSMAGPAFAQAILPDGRTATSVSTAGAVTDVRTGTINGANAFNSFSRFNVPAATIANLHVPTGAANLINLVRDERSNIDGVLNAVKDGRIGGNVWFANPYGMFIGASGVVNVGTLNVSTPTQQFVNNFFLSPGMPDPAAVGALLSGTAPRNPDGTIVVNGRINAIDGVNLSAGMVNVGGVVFAGARFVGNAPDFSDVVNANGLNSATNVIAEGGRIRIVADADVTVAGTLATPGAAGVKAGEVEIRAGRDVDLQAGARIVAAGAGAASGGGKVTVLAERNAINREGSLLDASAGTSGAGGFVEFSAKDTVELAGGALRADGTGGGAGGAVYVDPATINVSQNLLRGDAGYANGSGITVTGADIVLEATSSINVAAGKVISSRAVATPTDVNSHLTGNSTGNSGKITLKAPSITLAADSAVLANATGAFTAGDVTFTADLHASSNLMGIRDATTSIQIGDTNGGATVRGANVSMVANTSVDTKYYYNGDAPVESNVNLAVTSLDATALGGQAAAFGLSLLGINVVHSQSTGISSVTVGGTAAKRSVIEGTGSVTLKATNSVSSGITTAVPPTPGAQVATPLGVGALYATTKADARVDVQQYATIKGGDLTVQAHNDASIDGKISAGAVNSQSNQLSIAFGYTSADVDANATIAQGAQIKSTGTVTVAASNFTSLKNEVESVTGPNGKASAAVAWSDHNTSANARLLADVADAKNVNVLAVDHVTEDRTAASASAGTGAFAMVQNAIKQETVQGLEDFFWKRFGLSTQKIDQKVAPTPAPFRISGAISYVDSVHGAVALIGDGVKIHASDTGNTGTVLVAARTIGEKTVISADTATSSPSIKAAATPASGSPSRINAALGLAIGNYSFTSSATVGRNADITADKIGVSSDVKLPIRPSILFGNAEWNFDRWDGLSTLSEAMNTINFLDVMNGKSSAKVAGSSDETSMGFSGSANIISFQHTAQAEVQDGARLNVRDGSTGGATRSFTTRPADADTYDPTGTILLFRGRPADTQAWALDAPVSVTANVDTTLLFQAGAPQLAIGSSNKAIGFSLSQIDVASVAEAVVRENVAIRGIAETAGAADADGVRAFTVTATDKLVDDVRVRANTSDKVFSFGASAGKASDGGNPIAVNGIVTLIGVNNRTVASLDNEASVTARKLAVDAGDNTVAWSIAGAVNLSSSTAVGIGLGINDVTTDTRAEIADNDTYSLTGSARASAGSYTGSVKARDIDVEARTGGRVEAIGIAGSVSNSAAPGPGPGFFDKASAAYQTAMTDLTNNILGVSPAQPTRSRSSATATKPPAPTPPTFGLSGAGSAAVNMTDMKTTARIDSASVDQSGTSSTTPSLLVRAVSDADITTAAGSGALTRANNPSQTRAVGVAGAVAVNMIGNGTEAYIKGSTVTGARDVDVQALTGGEQLSLGIGAAVVLTPDNNPIPSYAVAGSVSITLSPVDGDGNTKNYAKARIEDSSVTGDGNAAADLDVTAYSRKFIGTGGGSLAFGGKSGVGAAVSYADLRSDTEAKITGSTVKQFQTVTVEAYNASEIGAGGGSATVSERQDGTQLGGAFVITQVQNRTTAEISGNSSVTAAGRIDVIAKESGAITTYENIIDESGERANVAKGLDYCGRQAGVGAAGSGSCITSVAGVVQVSTGGGSSNVGISYVQNLIGNTVTARVENAKLDATGASSVVNIEAGSATHILGLALGAGSSEKFSGAGSVVVSQTQNAVKAEVSAPAANASYRSITGKTITIKASDSSTIDSVAGQVVNSNDQTAIGAAISYNDIDNDVYATASGVALNAQTGITVEAAQANSAIRNLSVAGALAGGQAAVTASISVNQITNDTEAKLDGVTTTDGNGGTNIVKVWAHDDSSIESLAGNVAVGKKGGAGAAFAYNSIDNETLAHVADSSLTEASQIDVLATQNAGIKSLSAAIGGSGSGNAFAGSISTNFISNDTTAELMTTGITGSTADVTVKGSDTSTISSASGGAAVAFGSAGVGIAASINRIANTADAHVSGAADASVRSLVVDAKSDATIDTVAVALGAAASLGVGGSNATNLMDNSTRAYIANGARVMADNNVGVFAFNDDKAKVIAGAAGASPGAAGAGVSVVVNMMDGTTDAHIDGGSTQVDAKGLGAAMTGVRTGDLVTPVNVNAVLAPTYTHADLTETTQSVRGIAVTATSHQSAVTNAATLGLGSSAGIALTPVVNVLGGTTKSYIQDAKVNSRLTTFSVPDLFVNASSHTYAGAFVIGAAGSTGVGAAGAAATNLMERKTYAYLTNATTGVLAAKSVQAGSVTDTQQRAVNDPEATDGANPVYDITTTNTFDKTLMPTLGAVKVGAKASQSAANVVAGFAAGSGGIAGTGVVNRFSADTQAHVDGGAVSAASLGVNALTTSGYNAVAGAGAIGASAGGAASFVVGIASNSTKAWVGDPSATSNTTALRLAGGDLTINAATNSAMNSLVVSGAVGGGAGIAGMADVTLLNNTTVAGMYRTTAGDTAPAASTDSSTSSSATNSSGGTTTTKTVTRDRTGSGKVGQAMGAISISAAENVDIDAKAGAGGGGGAAGVGAGANVVIVKSQVTGEMKNSTVTTPGTVTVAAGTIKDVDMVTATAGAGGTVGIGGSAAVLLIGDGTAAGASAETDKNGSGTLSSVSSYSNSTPTVGGSTGLTTAEQARLASTRYNTSSAVGSGAADAVTANIESSSVTAGSVAINASGQVSTTSTVGAGAAGTVGVGGAVGYTRIYDNIIAKSTASTLNAANVAVGALMRDNGTDSAAKVKAYVGAAGLVGVGAGVADAIVRNTVSASLGGTVTGGTGTSNTVLVSAQDTSSVATEGVGAAVGAGAVGVVASIADKESQVTAETLAGANVTQYKTIGLTASESGAVTSSAIAAAGGIVAGTGAGSTARDQGNVTATARGTLAAGEAVNVTALATPDVSATAWGVAVGGFSVGASIALAEARPTVTASVADSAAINGAGALAVSAGVMTPTTGNSADADTIAGSGGTLLGANATLSQAISGATVRASVGNSVTLPAGDVSVAAINNTRQKATSTGVAAGYVAMGANVAEAKSSGITEAWMGTGVVTTQGRAGSVSIIASGKDEKTAEATSGAGGMFAGNAATATTDDTSSTKAWIAGNATRTTIYGDDFIVNASHNDTSSRLATSVNASVAGASGAVALHTGNSTVEASLGSTLTLNAAGVVEVEASNTFKEDRSGDSATGAAGGVLSGAAVLSRTTLTGNTDARFANDVTVNSGTDPVNNTGGIVATASTWATASDQVSLATGGAIAGAGTESTYRATFNNNVTFGTNNQLKSQGNIGAGTWTVGSVDTAAQVNTWGLASVGSANATTDITNNQKVTIGGGTGAVMEAFGNVNITAGKDPLGSYDTAMTGSSNAQGYVRGLVAVPDANALTRLAGNAEVQVDDGAHLRSGQNITVGAYNGQPMGTSTAEGRGYQLYFIPVTAGDSTVTTPSTSKVTFNGDATAGVYHTLDIAINGNSLTYNNGAAPFIFAYNPVFDPQQFVADNYSGTQAQLLASGVSTGTVGAFELGTLYAAGGTATINADTLAGNGTFTSYGSPTISVKNNSGNYLLLNSVYIPNQPGGKVIFTGQAGRAQADAAGLHIDERPGTGTSKIDIDNAYNGKVGDGNYGPALFLGGAIENLGGAVLVNNNSGSLGQNSTIYGQQVNVTIPNGVAVITNPGTHYAGGNPYSEWSSYMLWPGGNPATVVPDATEAVVYAINAIYNANGQFTTTDALTSELIGSAGQNRNYSWVWFGNCAAFAKGDCSGGTADRLSPAGYHHDISGSGGSFAKVPVRTLSRTGSFANASLAGSANSSQIYGGKVSIVANTIDVNGKISAGRPTQWSLNLGANLTDPLIWGDVPVGYTYDWSSGLFPKLVPVVEHRIVGGGTLAYYKYLYDSGQTTNPVFDIPGGVGGITRGGDSYINATYNAVTNEISLGEVRASSGGGYVGLNGKIISTNTLGNIHVNGGLGDVQVVNNTGLALNLNKINTGNTAVPSALVSEVEIVDKNRASGSNHWVYTYSPGAGMNVFQGSEFSTKDQLKAGSAVSSSQNASTTFNPVAGLRWEWKLNATLSRPFDTTNWTYGNWTFSSGTQNNPWRYVNQSGGNATSTPQGYLLSGQDNSVDFRQSITATQNWGASLNVHYHGCDGSSCNYGFNPNATGYTNSYQHGEAHAWWQYRYVTGASLTLTQSVKASNPFGIDFSGNSRGSVAVTSNAPVVVNNALVNPNGTTTISSSGGSITESATGSVLTNSLNLSAKNGIGSTDRAFTATLTGGDLSATAGSDGVYLRLNSGAALNTIRSQTGASYGDVVIQADNALTAVAGSAANVEGRNITLSSELGGIGSETAPVRLSAHYATQPNGLVSGGVVNVSAQNDIGLTQLGGDLLIGSIASTAGGNLYVNVPNGTIYGAAGQTAAQALSDTQVRNIWQNLKLTAAYGAETNAVDAQNHSSAASVTRFESQVNVQYEQYWRLLGKGTVDAQGQYTLATANLDLYRALAAAATGVASPTDAQVQAYAAGLYASATGSLQSLLGSGWKAAMGSSYSSTFAFHASLDQINDLTKNAVWTEPQLNASINGSALQPGTPVGIGNPNLTGRDIKLNTSGAIGKLAAPVTIKLTDLQSGNLTPEQSAALALANVPGSVVAVDAAGNPVASGTQPYAFQIQQTAPVFVNATGKFTATAGGLTYVQSTAQNITLDKITAGGAVSVTAPQSILSAGTSAVNIQTPGDVTLLAGTGSIGDINGLPLVVQANRLVSASAGQDAYVRGTGANFTFGRVAAGGTAWLDAPAGNLVSYLDGVVVDAKNVRLDAGGNVGSPGRYVKVDVDADGLLSGTAGGAAYIDSPDSSLQVGTYAANGGLNLTATGGDLTAQQLRSSNGIVSASAAGSATIAAVNGGISTASSGNVSLTAVDDLSVGDVTTTGSSVTLLAGGTAKVTGNVHTDSGAIGVTGATVDIATGGQLDSTSGAIAATANSGNLYVNRVASGKTNGQAITLTATTGRIVESDSDAAADIVANGTGALVTLTARDGIGDATRTGANTIDTATPNALEMQVAGLSATSSQGAIRLSEADGLILGNVVAGGALQLTVGGALTGTLAQSTGGSVAISANSVDLTTVQAATTAGITSTAGSLQVGSATSAGNLTLQGQAGITAGTLTTTGTGTIDATAVTGSLVATTVDSNAAVSLTASAGAGDIKVDTVEGQNAVTLTAGRSIGGRTAARYVRVESLGGGVTLDAQGGDVMGTTTTAFNNAQVTASNNVDLTTTQASNGTLTVTATNGAITLDSANAETQMTLDAKTALTARSLTTDSATSGLSATTRTGDLTATTVDSAGSASLTATAGNIKVDIVEGQNAVTLTAGQSIGGRAASRYSSIESLGGNVTLDAQGGDVMGTTTTAFNSAQVTAGNNVDLTTTQASNGTLTVTATNGSITLDSANAETQMTLDAKTALTARLLTTDSATSGLSATARTGDLTATTVDSAGSASLTATAGNIKVDTVEGQNAVTLTAGQSIGGRTASRYASIESLGGNVTLDAQGGDVMGTTTTAFNNAQVTAGNNVDLTTTQASNGTLTVTATNGSITIDSANAETQMTLDAKTALTARLLTTDSVTSGLSATARTGDLTATTVDSAGSASLTATAGNIKVDMVEGQNAVTLTAGQSIGGRAASRYSSIESLGGNVTLSAQGGDVMGTTTTAFNSAQVTASNNVDLTTTQASNGTLTVTATNGAITLDSANAETQMTLDAKTALTARLLTTDSVTSGLSATARTGDLTATTVDSAGSASLTATAGNIKVDTVEGQNAVTLTAGQSIGGRAASRYSSIESLGGNVTLEAQGGDVMGTTTTALNNAQVTASNNVDLTMTQASNGTLTVTATNGSITLDSANAETQMTLDAKTALTANSLTTDSATSGLSAMARTGDLTATTVDSSGSVTLTATAANIKVDTVEGQNAVSLTAGQSIGGRAGARYVRVESLGGNVTMDAQNGDITGDATTALNNAQLTGHNNVDLATTTAKDGSLTVRAQTGTITIGSANAETLMSLTGQTGITATNLGTDSGGIVATASTGDLTATTSTSAAAATFTATTGSVKVDVLQGQDDVTVTAGQSIGGTPGARYTRIESLGGNVYLNAQNGNVTGDTTTASGSAQVTARNNADLATTTASNGSLTVNAQTGTITIGTANAETAMNLTGQSGITAGALTTDTGSIAATATTGDLTATTTDSANAVTLTAGTGNVKVGTVEGRNAVTITAAQSIGGTPGTAYGRVESLGGNAVLSATAGNIDGTLTRANGAIALSVGNDLNGGTVIATLGPVNAVAGANVNLGQTQSAGDITLFATRGAINVNEVISSAGSARLTANRDINANLVAAAEGDAVLDSTNGNIHARHLVGGGLLLYARDAIVGDNFEVGRRLVLVSDSVDASVQHTRSSPALITTLIGRYNPVMSNVKLTINSPLGVTFDNLQAVQGALTIPTGTLEVQNGYIVKRMTIDNPLTHMLVDNTTPGPDKTFDLQLFSRPGTFYLYLDRDSFVTRGADIIHRSAFLLSDHSHTVHSESTGLDSSVAETSVEEQTRTVRLVQPPMLPPIQVERGVVQFTGVPVQMPEFEPVQLPAPGAPQRRDGDDQAGE
ncbi:leukotoxin LktA family filamentous adhesin [Ramlibacter humi]|uniref:Leukotoxin LktA family filamentous adhesin n=1 Tax=Ramlibacter humi TaxID=2530451 RepID=A0A4Z0BFR4_9BURK|nr:leukotoxin LktA family filamentous adhesin [Ramlibacter humi]TFY97147.1 leukotoxin LktA family filamentous adhesin [Ramlibacter humi]